MQPITATVRRPEDVFCGTVHARIATAVALATTLSVDLRTIPLWAHAIGVAPSTLKNWCTAAGISARQTLVFLRLLRAVRLGQCSVSALAFTLEVVDPRTLAKFVILGGGAAGGALPGSVEMYLERQLLVRSPDLLSAVRKATAQTAGGLIHPQLHPRPPLAIDRDRELHPSIRSSFARHG